MGTANFDIVGSILKIFSNEEHIDLIKIIANEGGGSQRSTPELLIDKFDLNKRDFNSRIERLMTLGLLDMINNHYCLTQLGKEIYDSLIMIENATREFLIQ
jgi:predicted transcriptional regulator